MTKGDEVRLVRRRLDLMDKRERLYSFLNRDLKRQTSQYMVASFQCFNDDGTVSTVNAEFDEELFKDLIRIQIGRNQRDIDLINEKLDAEW